jgi:heme A synthase
VTFLALSVHLLAAAVWLGAMAYSLAVVQPRSQRFLDDERRREAFAVELAAGARLPVLGVIVLLAGSGAALVALEAGDGPGSGWWAIVGVKVALLAAAAALFWHVSWRLWPRRLFAAPDELPHLRGHFRVVAWALLVLVGLEVVLGAAAATVT